LINSLMRRPEAYHQRLRSAAEDAESGATSIHDQNRSKEPGLAGRLVYDRWPRNAFRLLVFDAPRTAEDYARLRLEENAALAGGNYSVIDAGADQAFLRLEGDTDWSAGKEFRFASRKGGFDVTCAFSVVPTASTAAVTTSGASLPVADGQPIAKVETQAPALASGQRVGMEVVVNMLAPDVANRYFQVAGDRHPLGFAGVIIGDALEIIDQWQGVQVTLEAPGAREFWIAPIETISESEDGFERVYQGSQILAVWQPDVSAVAPWSGALTMRVSRISR
jgi:alpha-amylase